ncbi:bifunctional oligoribonuclease/PAP phosphatase NrnA [Halovenus sp. WSH3]|uniref:Bifunctional oligoribonuclease/PAP phosphatase NrnA n=1 Tax=Halovenus carboxidivorans TaxID=2692199 RepID=A0A6B0SY90_9EURY|nr:DHHA1 domain-containing protein [Halovenus carboxidivorans]MXR50147.1 bifunctional oligoribonuclease/PAP phosphatase NrnA [Halovenus carboxidivorans]
MLVAGVVGVTLSSAVTVRPLVLAALAGAVLLPVGYLIYRRFFAPPGKRFARAVGSAEEVAVLMHPNPDPDAMSSALGARAVADSVDTETTLYYPGQIRHHENRAFQTVLDVTFQRIDSADDIDEQEVVLVDHNEARGFEGAEAINPLAVVDHHPGGGTAEEFTDARTDYGACATIFAEYLRQIGKEPIPPDDADGTDRDGTIPPRVATALVHGIQSDTKHLTNGCSAAEFDAASFLYHGIDQDKLDRIANPEIDAESLEVKARAITDRQVEGAFAVSDVGTVSNADAIPQAADELRRLEGINAVVVLGDNDGAIQLSGRSTDDRVHMGKVLETAVESVPMAEAGGHARMGGGQVPLDHMEGLAPGEGLTREELKARLFDAMNGAL